jgi:lysophospholipase L1-like esterase
VTLFDENVLKYDPQIVLYQLGSNDNYFGITDEEYRDNLQNTISQILNVKKNLLLMSDLPSGYPEHNEKYKPRKKILEDLAEKNSLPYLDLYSYFEDLDITQFFSLISGGNEEAGIKRGEVDMIHPNIKGNAYIAKAILTTFFNIDFNVETYLEDLQDRTVFYPRF